MSRLKSGGIEWLVVSFLQSHRSQLGEVTFWLTGKEGEGELTQLVEDLDCRLIYSSNTSNGWTQFKKFLSENRVDAVHAHTGYPSGYFILLAERAGVPVRIGHWHNMKPIPSHPLKKWVAKDAMKKMAKNTTHVFAVSEPVKKALQVRSLISKCTVVPNGYRIEEPKSSQQQEKLQILHVGRFHPVKNHNLIWRILEHLEIPFQFTACGRHDHPELLPGTEWVQRMTAKHKDDKVIQLPGNCNDVQAQLEASEVFLFPSFSEGTGGALVEAAAKGCFCITSDIPSLQFVAQHFDNIKLIPLDAPIQEWIDAIENRPTLDRQKAYQQYLRSPFTSEQMEEYWLEVYRQESTH